MTKRIITTTTTGLSAHLELELNRRWKELEPALLIFLKSQPLPTAEFHARLADYRTTHLETVLLCLRQGITFRALRRTHIDDPTLSPTQRAERIAKFLSNRASRPERLSAKLGGPHCRWKGKGQQPILPGDI